MFSQSSPTPIVVIGLGYVGLPVAIEFARQGLRVVGIEKSADKVRQLSEGMSYVRDVSSEELVKYVEGGQFSATSDPSAISGARAVIVCVPTPLSKTKEPDIRAILTAVDMIAEHRAQGLLVVLESTTYPGTTSDLVVPRLTSSDFELGRDIFVAFSPERMDPGNKKYGIRNTPKVIAGATPACLERAIALYSRIVDTLVPVSSLETAETVKLFENTFRAVNIALVNEVAMMARMLGVDPFEVMRAAATKPFGFMPFSPGPGLGGHCIPVDPLYWSWKLKAHNYNAQFIELADKINSGMPMYVVSRLADCLNEVKKPVNGSRILIYGVAYKPDIEDARESPAIGLIHELVLRGADVAFMDPHVPLLNEQGICLEAIPDDAPFSNYDAVVIVTNHAEIPEQRLLSEARLILDTRDSLGELGRVAPHVRGL